MMRLLDRLEETLIASLIAAATGLIFASVVHRYSLGILADGVAFFRSHDLPELSAMMRSAYFWLRGVNLVWAQELCIILFVWMAKFGAAYGVRTGIHVGIDVLINKLDMRRRGFFILLGLMAGALFTGIIATLGGNFVWHMSQTSAISPDLEMPMWIVYLAIPLGSALMCFRFLQVAFTFWRTGELPHHDHGHVEGLDEEAEAIADSPLTLKDK
ncbi:TRAP transporter small permease [Cereibacter azotoformans]|uniref:TRAP transporter small permease protein n=2 Tax=Cereibacter TaxID=1653176 RepID=A0A2T5KEN9_9RHOB|nr:TRAP transporter small permease [Cereibacter azotoformans]AXQ92516.1 TRAP transporter small permease [Cereibacter sphaeroides]MBO4169906.1 TRAP transporter small permease [Cereibacter azotoformans]PTR20832.1 C4-dicarboxylate transporter DctQ subunit [Cereibacter azotoformans]UIJ30792.1 TRAP transporter small permease [Cereibacter azotoformans]ULB08553.1 TRAP transporter small permease [Cereibacter azotoformans]